MGLGSNHLEGNRNTQHLQYDPILALSCLSFCSILPFLHLQRRAAESSTSQRGNQVLLGGVASIPTSLIASEPLAVSDENIPAHASCRDGVEPMLLQVGLAILTTARWRGGTASVIDLMCRGYFLEIVG